MLGRVKNEKVDDKVIIIKNSTIEKYKQVPESISKDFSVSPEPHSIFTLTAEMKGAHSPTEEKSLTTCSCFLKVIQWEWSNCMEVVLRLQIGELEKNDQHRSLVCASWHNSHHPQFLPSQNLAALPLSSKINAMLIFPHCRPCPPKYCSSRWLC